ncbi:MAG: hypothetical protein IAE66_05800 [Xanthomonadaceae bacterium]|nr:hypothetical protein [Xanthomonadaceae bacterium]
MRPIPTAIALPGLLALGLCLNGSALAQQAKRAPDPAIEAQLKALDYKYEVDDDGDYKLVFDMDEAGTRSQLVFVRSAVEDYDGHKSRDILSPGYRASGDALPANVANRLLEASMDNLMGGWSKQGNLAIFIVRIPADASKETLDAAITAAINSADQMEAELTPGQDEF